MDTGDLNMLENLLLPGVPEYFLLLPPNQLAEAGGEGLPGTSGSCMAASSGASRASLDSCDADRPSSGSDASAAALCEEPVWRDSRMSRCSSRLV
jgi:hypothetical protein